MNALFSKSLAASVGLALGSTAALAHARLDHASPPVGSTVSGSPRELTLTFTESLEPKFSGAVVQNASGARVDQGSSAVGATLRVNVKALALGVYNVSWHVLSVDTHKTEGSYSFHVGK